MPKLLVIADDLSGATDVGVQFAKQGVSAFVVIRHEERPALAQLFGEFEVVLVNIESRHVSPQEAGRRVSTLVEQALAAGVEFFYKKTDSTLRGNVGAELDALLAASGARTLCFVPAHPVLGRTTCGGVQFVNGTPLHESAYARDARNPVRDSRIAALLEDFTEAPIAIVRQSELAAFAECRSAGIVVFDAETETDIVCAGAAIRRAGCLHTLAGPAALASCLPDLIPFKRTAPKAVPVPERFLVVNGSLNEVALRQCSEAKKCGFHFVRMSATALLSDAAAGDRAREEASQEASALLRGKRDVLLGSVADLRQLSEFSKAGNGILAAVERWPERIAFNTGRIVQQILSEIVRDRESNSFKFALAVIGGDTLTGVAQANHWKGFLPRGEPLPGLAVCEIAELPGLRLISKPGGFGDEYVLCAMRTSGRES